MPRPALSAVIAAALLLALSACATPAGRAGSGIPDVAPGTISADTLREVTATLSSDAFEGRAPGTMGEERTVAYLAEQFARAGVRPGNQGSWFQDVPLVEITGGGFAPLAVTGGAKPLNFQHGQDWVGVTYRETDEVALAGSEIVFVGHGIVAPEKGWNDYAGVDMRGKTALILVNDPDYAETTLTGPFNGRAMTYYGRWTYKFEEAARQGAAAALIVHDTFPAAYGWNVVESSWTGPQAHAERTDGGASQTMMNGWVQKPVAEQILAAAGQDLAALSGQAKLAGFRAVPLGVSLAARFTNTIRRFRSRNVIAILPGSRRADEYVLHSAHWDHLGRCRPNAAGDDICNGAVDNATGTAALVALAEAHARAGPTERSQVFLAVTAEESGLLGSEYYGAHPVFPLARTVGGLNMDALLPTGPARDVTVIGLGKSGLDAYLMRALAAEGRVATPEPAPEKGYYYRSDHFSFAKRGVPMLYVDGGEDLLDGGREAGAMLAARYSENAYHAPDDEFDPAWDWSGILHNLQLYYRIGRMLGESREWPNWTEGDEFRHLRDESCAPKGGC